MSQEHANSYTVDTSGIRRLVANITGDKHYRSTAQKVVDLQQLALRLNDEVHGLQERERELQDRVRQNEAKHTELYVHVHNLQEYLKQQQTIDANQTEAIRALQKVVLKIPGNRVENLEMRR